MSFVGGGPFGGGSFGGGLFGGGNTGGMFPKKKSIVREIIKQTDTPVGELFKVIDDTKEELYELCTDGFKEMVIEGNKDYKTSFEVKDEADEIIARAKSKYEKRCCEFNAYLENLNTEVESLYSQKVELANRINQKVQRIPYIPKFKKDMDIPVYSYEKDFMSLLSESFGLETGIDVRGKKESANEYWENANDYEVSIAGKIAEINKVQTFLDSVKNNLKEEECLIKALNDSINNKRKLKYSEIEKQLHILITEYILDTHGNINEKYIEAIEKIKCIS